MRSASVMHYFSELRESSREYIMDFISWSWRIITPGKMQMEKKC